MLFYKIERKASLYASKEETKIKFRFYTLLAWLSSTTIFIVLAIVAFLFNWSEGGKIILGIASAMIGTGGLGIALGEKSAIKALKNNEE